MMKNNKAAVVLIVLAILLMIAVTAFRKQETRILSRSASHNGETAGEQSDGKVIALDSDKGKTRISTMFRDRNHEKGRLTNFLANNKPQKRTSASEVIERELMRRKAASADPLPEPYIVDENTPPEMQEKKLFQRIKKTQNNLRTTRNALETYYIDWNNFPESTTDSQLAMYPGGLERGKQVPTFLNPSLSGVGSIPMQSLTTPVSYLTRIPSDDFSFNQPSAIGYFAITEPTGAKGYVIFSPGPDGKYDFDWELFSPSLKQPSPDLLNSMYDPTNGILSSGDILLFGVKKPLGKP